MAPYRPKWLDPKPGSGRLVAKLVAMLRREGFEIAEGWQFFRVYAGRHQRSAGAWSWRLTDAGGREILGSCDPVRDCLRYGVESSVHPRFPQLEVHARYHATPAR